MLPWIFTVLLALNLALFAWGWLGDQAVEPVPPPIPEGAYEIQLLSEVRPGASLPAGANGSAAGAAAVSPAAPYSGTGGNPVRHTETALGRAMVPAASGAGETADSPSPAIPTVHLSPEPAADDREPSAESDVEAATADPAAQGALDSPSGGEADSPAVSPDKPDAKPSTPLSPQRQPLPDPDPPAPGDEDAPREAAV